MCHICFIHSSVDGHLGCFHVLTIVNSAVMNTGVLDGPFWLRVEISWQERLGQRWRNSEVSAGQGAQGGFGISLLRKWQVPQQCGGGWLKTVSLPPSQPLSLDTSQTVDPFILDAITYYVRMGTQPVYFQIYTVKVSFPPGAPMRPWQPVGLQDPWLRGNGGPGCKS